MTIHTQISATYTRRQARQIADDPWAEWRRSVDVRRFMTSRFVRRGASYGEAIRAAHTLFPLAKMPERGPFPFGENA